MVSPDHRLMYADADPFTLDCAGDGNLEQSSYETLRASWFSAKQETASLLFEWKFGLSTCSIPQRGCSFNSDIHVVRATPWCWS